jgi:hypothetical protein
MTMVQSKSVHEQHGFARDGVGTVAPYPQLNIVFSPDVVQFVGVLLVLID